jgi:hypothetical protein
VTISQAEWNRLVEEFSSKREENWAELSADTQRQKMKRFKFILKTARIRTEMADFLQISGCKVCLDAGQHRVQALIQSNQEVKDAKEEAQENAKIFPKLPTK